MEAGQEVNAFVNAYCSLRDRQYAVYAGCAKAHRLTVNELFVLDLLWFSPEGQTQKEICDRLSANKQTIAAIAGRFLKKGFVSAEEVAEDRRNKRLRLTKAGTDYARGIIPSAAEAENRAMARLGTEKMDALVRLTAEFTENMEQEFSEPAARPTGRTGR